MHTEKVRKEFSKQTEQAVLMRRGAWPDKHTDHHTVYVDQSCLFSCPSYFPPLVLVKSPKPLPGSSPNHPIISSLQSWNPLPRHPLCPVPQGTNPPEFWKCPGIDDSWWVSHLDTRPRLTWDNLGKPGQGIPSSEPTACVPTCLHPPGS